MAKTIDDDEDEEFGKGRTGAALRGIETVAQALRFEDFPTDKQNLYYSIGDIEVEGPEGHFVPVRVVLDQVNEERFMTPRDALQALCRAIDHMSSGRAA